MTIRPGPETILRRELFALEDLPDEVLRQMTYTSVGNHLGKSVADRIFGYRKRLPGWRERKRKRKRKQSSIQSGIVSQTRLHELARLIEQQWYLPRPPVRLKIELVRSA